MEDKIITDGEISLIRNKTLSENEDLKLSQAECFDIICNKTLENVGVISYRYHNLPNYIDYGGNINYRIKENQRGNGFAKRALTLMLYVLQNNTKFDEPLYVSSILSNKNYLNVAASCGGKLIHSGIVPNNVIGSFYDKEMRNVELYEFNIEKIEKYGK